MEVVHQDKDNYIKAINELCSGHPSGATVTFLKSLNRPIVTDKNTEYIFGTRFDIDMFNHDKLQEIQGDMWILRCTDKGRKKYLRTSSASRILPLKVNCKIIVIQNLENGLVNRLTGIVPDIKNTEISVKIDKSVNLNHKM